jgi:hypothetical protein
MATTTNYGWTTPNDTDLVKDGAAAIRTLGSSVDTTTKALNPSTTLGDVEYRSATANTNTRLGIGSTGDVLTVTGGVPVWAAPAVSPSGLTLITAQSFSAAGAVNVNNCFSSTYQNYLLNIVISTTSTGSDAIMRMRVGGADATGSDYKWAALWNNTSSATPNGTMNNGTTSFNDSFLGYGASGNVAMTATVFCPNQAVPTLITSQAVTEPFATFLYNFVRSGKHTLSTAYDGFSLITNGGTITGNLRVYGLAN